MTSKLRFEGPLLGSDLPPEWHRVVDMAKPWASCRLRSYWFAAVDTDMPVAVGGLDPDFPGGGWLGPTFVLPSYRGRGIQASLIKLRLGMAVGLELPAVKSAADLTNSASVRNLLNAGFRIDKYNQEHKHLEMSWKPHR